MLRFRNLIPPVENASPGFCDITAFGSSCETDSKGAWELGRQHLVGNLSLMIATPADCVDACRHCRRCNYISFSTSPSHDECSWYQTCDVAHLQFFGSGPDYVTLDLRGVPKKTGPLHQGERPLHQGERPLHLQGGRRPTSSSTSAASATAAGAAGAAGRGAPVARTPHPDLTRARGS